MSLTVDQNQELVRWLESAWWWPELPYAILKARIEALKLANEHLRKRLLIYEPLPAPWEDEEE